MFGRPEMAGVAVGTAKRGTGVFPIPSGAVFARVHAATGVGFGDWTTRADGTAVAGKSAAKPSGVAADPAARNTVGAGAKTGEHPSSGGVTPTSRWAAGQWHWQPGTATVRGDK
jgi:hypothetical protein